MSSLLLYLIQASLSISVFYLAYEILFKHEAYFKFIRYYFILAIITSTILPLTHFSIGDFVTNQDDYIISIAPVHDMLTFTLDEVIITANDNEIVKESAITFAKIANIFLIIYILGVVLTAVILVYRLLHLAWLVINNRDENHGRIKIIHLHDSPVFSFFNIVFMDKDWYLSNRDSDKILAHESIHISQKHTLDILIIELLLVIQWFNPFVYLIRKRIKENHEFLADNSVIDKYSDSMEYYKLLVENSTNIRTNILTLNFSYSLLKRRLFMISRTKSPGLFALKMLGVVIALSMVVYACSGPIEEQLSVDNIKSADNVKKVEPINAEFDIDSIYVATLWNPDKPEITFTVTIGKAYNTRLDVFNSKNQLVQTLMEGEFEKGSYLITWKPENNNRIPADSYTYKFMADEMLIDGKFTYGDQLELPIPPKSSDVFTVVEVMPKYPGGNKELMTYIANNVKYPEEAKKNKIQGRVFVSFVVEKDGSIGDVKVLRGIGGGCDEESIRVVENMPNWVPGMQRGKAVRVAYNLPIKFALN